MVNGVRIGAVEKASQEVVCSYLKVWEFIVQVSDAVGRQPALHSIRQCRYCPSEMIADILWCWSRWNLKNHKDVGIDRRRSLNRSIDINIFLVLSYCLLFALTPTYLA